MEEGVENLSRNLKQILTNVRAHNNQDDVVKKPGKYLGPAIRIYADFLRPPPLMATFSRFSPKQCGVIWRFVTFHSNIFR